MDAAAVPPAELVTLRELVDRELGTLIAELHARFAGTHPLARVLSDELERYLAGGKRLRPALLLLGHRVAGGGDPREVVGPALALELVHTCALLHDDLIDEALERRGRPASHLALAARHEAAGWDGDPAAYGRSTALLLGDLAHVAGDELFLRAGVDRDRLFAAFSVFTTLREEVTVGQFLDVTVAARRGGTVDEALEVASLKSARYSVARPLQLGALLSGADPAVASGLYRFGIPLGQAFQLRDDVLGVFGEEATTGKSAVSDLREGKRTHLVAVTLERLDRAGRDRLERALGRDDLSSTGADEVRELMRRSGGLEATEERIDELVRAAFGTLGELNLTAEGRTALRSLATYLARRDS